VIDLERLETGSGGPARPGAAPTGRAPRPSGYADGPIVRDAAELASTTDRPNPDYEA
jgi:hypothetical protein